MGSGGRLATASMPGLGPRPRQGGRERLGRVEPEAGTGHMGEAGDGVGEPRERGRTRRERLGFARHPPLVLLLV